MGSRESGVVEGLDFSSRQTMLDIRENAAVQVLQGGTMLQISRNTVEVIGEGRGRGRG